MGEETIKQREKLIKELKTSIKESTDEFAKLIEEQQDAIKQSQVMVSVKCNGIPSLHKCENRKCLHRLPHFPKDQCHQQLHNFGRWWCIHPGTISPLDGQEDGSVVMCIPVGK